MFGQVLVGCSDILLQFGLLFGCLCLRQLLLPIGFKPGYLLVVAGVA